MVFWVSAQVFRGPKVLDPGSYLQRPRTFGSLLMFLKDQVFFGLWLMFSEDQRFWILAHVFRGPRIFRSWLIFSENRGFFRIWLMFSEDQRFWILARVFRCLGFLDLGSCFHRT